MDVLEKRNLHTSEKEKRLAQPQEDRSYWGFTAEQLAQLLDLPVRLTENQLEFWFDRSVEHTFEDRRYAVKFLASMFHANAAHNMRMTSGAYGD